MIQFSHKKSLAKLYHRFSLGFHYIMQLNEQILEILREYRILNTTEICRLVNGFERYDICHESDYKKYKSGSHFITACVKCKIHYVKVHQTLSKLKKEELVFTDKRRFWDDHPNARKYQDLFRFWFLDKEYFKEKIVKQTLQYYME